MGSVNYRIASRRLAHEFESTKLTLSSEGYDEKFLKEESPEFWQSHRKMLKPYIPGFGYWVWKAEFIRKTLNQIPENETLLYLDAGSFVDTRSETRNGLVQTLQEISSSSFGGSNAQDFREKDFCSSDLLNLLGIDSNGRNSNQFFGGFIFLKNNEQGREIVSQWATLICQDNHRFLVPTEYELPNDKNFVHHAYDQAIISCLFKKFQATNVLVGDRSTSGCIRLLRHRLATRYENPNILLANLFQAIGFLSRIKNGIIRRYILRNRLPVFKACVDAR
jgi:hypothetical protein